ncbi:MAG: YdiU family protein [Hyphomicrobiaceae bacterium]
MHDAPLRPPIGFDNSYQRLPERFYARLDPTPVATPRLVKLNVGLAVLLGLDADWLASDEGIATLAGNRVAEGSTPIAQAYTGHQFGHLQPQLGDGRAILLGEVIGRDGIRRDIQLKGSGPTPWSRSGDGRAALGPVLREYIVSEAFAALDIPTTRSLAAIATGEWVFRERALPGAILTRIARSHIRVGTFQYFAIRGDTEAVRLLADHVIARHYPQARDAANPYRALLDAVIVAQARLVARWMGVGFIHGVMNTDNCSIPGETIDFGPCAFMDTYSPTCVYSSIDAHGRYAYGRQPRIANWNLARLAECLLPLLGPDETAATAEAQAAIDGFPAAYQTAHEAVFRAKLGLTEPHDDDMGLIHELFELMAAGQADFTLTFRRLAEAADEAPAAGASLAGLFSKPAAVTEWLARWRQRLALERVAPAERARRMRAVNPAFIPRNHRVEQALAAAEAGDLAPFERLLAVLARPYDDQPEHADLMAPPAPHEVVHATFCGT